MRELLEALHMLLTSFQSSTVRLLRKASSVIVDSVVNELSTQIPSSLFSFLEDAQRSLGLRELSSRAIKDVYEVKIRGCPLAEKFHAIEEHRFTICPLVLVIASIVRRDTGRRVEVELKYLPDGVDAKLMTYYVRWIDLLEKVEKG